MKNAMPEATITATANGRFTRSNAHVIRGNSRGAESESQPLLVGVLHVLRFEQSSPVDDDVQRFPLFSDCIDQEPLTVSRHHIPISRRRGIEKDGDTE